MLVRLIPNLCQVVRQPFHRSLWQQKRISRYSSTTSGLIEEHSTIILQGKEYGADHMTNITPRILGKLDANLHTRSRHPLNLISRRIQNHFYSSYPRTGPTSGGSPLFAVFDNLSPVVSLYENFDSLLTPKNHPSRKHGDSYYVNKDYMLRAHTSAHQAELIRSGLDAFLLIGDVYRRDEIDATHYPVFHQVEGVRLYQKEQLFHNVPSGADFRLFGANNVQTAYCQGSHSMETAMILEHTLKTTLTSLAKHLFGDEVKSRWVSAYFPFTHPSWELEIFFNDEWIEVLGCGIIQQQILTTAGVENKVGWAFGLGLERLAMKLYSVPDIRIFWSEDPGVLKQFDVEDPEVPITYKTVSVYPSCTNDISFWLPTELDFNANDFYDLVGSVAGDVVESCVQKDVFTHPKNGRVSHCYTITYRHLEKTFTQEEVNQIHKQVEEKARETFGVEIR